MNAVDLKVVDSSTLIAMISDYLSQKGLIDNHDDMFEREMHGEIVHLLGAHTQRAIESGTHSFVLVNRMRFIDRAVRAYENLGVNYHELSGDLLDDEGEIEEDWWEDLARMLSREIPKNAYVAFPVSERF